MIGRLVLLLLLLPASAAAEPMIEAHTVQFQQVSFQRLLVIESVVVDAGGAPLRFRLPAGAVEVQLGENLERKGEELVASKASSGRTEYRFGYALPGDGNHVRLDRRLLHPVRRFLAYSRENKYRVHAEGVELRRGVVDRDGKSYVEFYGADLPAGHRIEITFSRLDARNPVGRLFVVLALLIVAGFLALVAGLSLDQRQAQRTRRYLLDQLTALEQAHAAGQVEDAYFKARQQELKELLER